MTQDGLVEAMYAYVDGELTMLPLDAWAELEAGDVFFFTQDSDGYVNRIIAACNYSVYLEYAYFYNNALHNDFEMIDARVAAGFVLGC